MLQKLRRDGFVVFEVATEQECNQILSLINQVLNDKVTDLLPYKLIHTSALWPDKGNEPFNNPYLKSDTVRHIFPKNKMIKQFTTNMTKRLNTISKFEIN